MPPSLENPFTPKSAIPQKRLFGDEERIVKRKLGKQAQERIKETKEKFVQYGDKQILKSQAKFLYEMEKELMGIAKETGKELSEKDVVEALARKIKLNESGSIIDINFKNMGLKYLPSLDKLTNLEKIFCNHNNLIDFPSLDKLTHLIDLSCPYNKLTKLPNLDNLTNLRRFACYENELASLPSFDKLTNLEALDCSINNLTSLPSLEKLTKLKLIACEKNKFSEQEKTKIKSQVPENCRVEI